MSTQILYCYFYNITNNHLAALITAIKYYVTIKWVKRSLPFEQKAKKKRV